MVVCRTSTCIATQKITPKPSPQWTSRPGKVPRAFAAPVVADGAGADHPEDERQGTEEPDAQRAHLDVEPPPPPRALILPRPAALPGARDPGRPDPVRRHPPPRLRLLALVAGHELGLAEHLALDRLQQVRLGLPRREFQLAVERVELEVIAVRRAAWRARTSVPYLAEVVHPLSAEARNRVLDWDALGQLAS